MSIFIKNASDISAHVYKKYTHFADLAKEGEKPKSTAKQEKL